MKEIVNLPRVIPLSFYQEAIDAFWQKAQEFMVALYRAGNITFPGLSDLDLLVVPKERAFAPLRLDVMHILPMRFHSVLLHNPFIIPQRQLAISRYCVLTNLTLMHGEPILSGEAPAQSLENIACDVLERLYNYSLFWVRQDSLDVLDARFCIAVCSSLRFTLKHLTACGIATDSEYSVEFDVMRQDFLQTKSASSLLTILEYAKRTYQLCVRSVREVWKVSVESRQEVMAALTGDVLLSDRLNQEVIRERYQAISGYLADLSSLRYWYGNIVPIAIYGPPKIPVWYSGVAHLVKHWHRMRNT